MSPSYLSFVYDVIDCSEHQHAGGKKDAKLIAIEMLEYMIKIDPKKEFITQIVLDGASIVQKAGKIMTQHYLWAKVNHGVKHVVVVVMKSVKMSPFKEYSKFAKLVSHLIKIFCFTVILF